MRVTACSLVERQVSVLRERNAELRRRLDLLVSRAQHNEALLSATQEVIAALAARSPREETSSLFSSLMRKHFEIDHAAYHLLDDDASAASKTAMPARGKSHGGCQIPRVARFSTRERDVLAALAIVNHKWTKALSR